MKRYVARALREAAERMGVSPKKLKRRLARLPEEQRAQFMAAKKRRVRGAAQEPPPAE